MLFARAQKTVEGDRVLAHLRVNEQRDIGMKVAERVKRRKRNMYQVAAPAYIHQHLVRPFIAKRSAQLRNHSVSTRIVRLPFLPARDYGGAIQVCQRE